MNYIEIPRWEDFQHYSKRDPIWIKNYTRLLHDDSYRELTPHQRAVLHGLWLLYASSGCQVAVNTASLSSQLGIRVSWKQLASLNDAGFIRIVASKPLAARYTREEKRREETISKDESSARGETAERESHQGKSKTPTEAEVVAARERREQSGWVDNLGSYTGCRTIRGEIGISHVYDPLGTEYPPTGWPHPTPTVGEIRQALDEKERVVA